MGCVITNLRRQTADPAFGFLLGRTGKIRFSGARKFVLLKPSSEERCAPLNFVLFVTLQGTRVRHVF